jgi:hypothetical protein
MTKPRSILAAIVAALVACGGVDGVDDGSPDARASDVRDAGTDAPGISDALPEADTAADAVPPTTPGGLPLALPFMYERAADGEPLTDAEIADFTARVTGFWQQIDYFTWAAETSAGMDVSTGVPDYLIWWHDVVAEKNGDTVTFAASAVDGGSHNNAKPTGVVLAAALAGHLMGGDEPMRYLAEQYTKSFSACMKGFVHDEDDPVDWLMARNLVGRAHAFTLPSGKKKAVDYAEWYFPYEGWNADRFRYPDNPTWGDIWVTNKRSKDDLPYWFRVAAWLPYVIELSPDEGVRAAAAEALDLLEKNARDIVDHGYTLRTKDANGNVFVPEDQDLASFVWYTTIVPDAECDARLGSALLGYGEPLDNECGTGQGSRYDTIAGAGNYFNYAIFNYFHQAAALLALTRGQADVARQLVEGLALRADRYRDPAAKEPGRAEASWNTDVAMFLTRAAVVGLPLTAAEARDVQAAHLSSLEHYQAFPNWDLWSPSVPDGRYSFRDGYHPKGVPQAFDIEDFSTLLEYCWSPFKNPAGARFVDCAVVADPTRWGTP